MGLHCMGNYLTVRQFQVEWNTKRPEAGDKIDILRRPDLLDAGIDNDLRKFGCLEPLQELLHPDTSIVGQVAQGPLGEPGGLSRTAGTGKFISLSCRIIASSFSCVAMPR